jgi:hypothetical protein
LAADDQTHELHYYIDSALRIRRQQLISVFLLLSAASFAQTGKLDSIYVPMKISGGLWMGNNKLFTRKLKLF